MTKHFCKDRFSPQKVSPLNYVMSWSYLSQVTNLRREREMMISRQQGESSGDAQRVRVLQRENAQLHLKMKGLLTELEEIRSQREHLGLQSDNVSRLQAKQLAEHAANVKSLEVNSQGFCAVYCFRTQDLIELPSISEMHCLHCDSDYLADGEGVTQTAVQFAAEGALCQQWLTDAADQPCPWTWEN